MADAARFMEAATESLGWEKGAFARLLRENRRLANQIVVETEPFAAALVAFLEEKDGTWRGTTTDLFTILSDRVSEKMRRSKMWPVSVNGASSTLNRTRDAIESEGFAFDRGHEGSKGKRFVQFWRVPKEST